MRGVGLLRVAALLAKRTDSNFACRIAVSAVQTPLCVPTRSLASGGKGRSTSAAEDTEADVPASDEDLTTIDAASLSDLDELITGGSEWSLDSKQVRERPLWMLYEDQTPMRKPPADAGDGDAGMQELPTLIKVPMRDDLGRAYATGRRKTSAARVWVKRGDGNIVVNGFSFVEYFPRVAHRTQILEPFEVTRSCGAFDIFMTVKGGGPSGQAGAARHGVAKALARFDPAMIPHLKLFGLTKRDPRMVERKKPGQKKARKKFQWVKR